MPAPFADFYRSKSTWPLQTLRGLRAGGTLTDKTQWFESVPRSLFWASWLNLLSKPMVLFGAVLKKSNKRRAILLWRSLGPPWGGRLGCPWGVPGEALGASLGRLWEPLGRPGGIGPGDCDSKTTNHIIL